MVLELGSVAESFVTEPPLEQLKGTEEPIVEKTKSKRSRSSRRRASKSEPSRLQDAAHDGAQDSDVTAVNSGESQPLRPSDLIVSSL